MPGARPPMMVSKQAPWRMDPQPGCDVEVVQILRRRNACARAFPASHGFSCASRGPTGRSEGSTAQAVRSTQVGVGFETGRVAGQTLVGADHERAVGNEGVGDALEHLALDAGVEVREGQIPAQDEVEGAAIDGRLPANVLPVELDTGAEGRPEPVGVVRRSRRRARGAGRAAPSGCCPDRRPGKRVREGGRPDRFRSRAAPAAETGRPPRGATGARGTRALRRRHIPRSRRAGRRRRGRARGPPALAGDGRRAPRIRPGRARTARS